MRNTRINNIRAFAIFLVVLGHSTILYAGWSIMETTRSIPYVKVMKRFVNILEMPLFMSVSGFVLYYSMCKMKERKDFLPFIWKKVKRVLIPFFMVGAFWMAPIRMAMDIKGWKNGWLENIWENLILQKRTGHLWYLISLFLIFFILWWVIYYLEKLEKPYLLECIVLLVCLFLSMAQKDGLWVDSVISIERMFLYLFWFYLGYLFHKYWDGFFKLDIRQKRLAGIGLILLFVCCFLIDHYKPSVISYYSSALFGVLATYVCMPDQTNGLVSILEKNSYGIYLFHSPMIYITFKYMANRNPYMVSLINLIGLGAISLGLTMLLRKTPLAFVIGEKFERRKGSNP